MDIGWGKRGYIKPETVRCRLSREVLKAVHRMDSLLNDRPHKLFRLEVEHGAQDSFLPLGRMRVKGCDFEGEMIGSQFRLRARYDTDVVLCDVLIVGHKEVVAARRQALRITSGNQTLVSRGLRIVGRQTLR